MTRVIDSDAHAPLVLGHDPSFTTRSFVCVGIAPRAPHSVLPDTNWDVIESSSTLPAIPPEGGAKGDGNLSRVAAACASEALCALLEAAAVLAISILSRDATVQELAGLALAISAQDLLGESLDAMIRCSSLPALSALASRDMCAFQRSQSAVWVLAAIASALAAAAALLQAPLATLWPQLAKTAATLRATMPPMAAAYLPGAMAAHLEATLQGEEEWGRALAVEVAAGAVEVAAFVALRPQYGIPAFGWSQLAGNGARCVALAALTWSRTPRTFVRPVFVSVSSSQLRKLARLGGPVFVATFLDLLSYTTLYWTAAATNNAENVIAVRIAEGHGWPILAASLGALAGVGNMAAEELGRNRPGVAHRVMESATRLTFACTLAVLAVYASLPASTIALPFVRDGSCGTCRTAELGKQVILLALAGQLLDVWRFGNVMLLYAHGDTAAPGRYVTWTVLLINIPLTVVAYTTPFPVQGSVVARAAGSAALAILCARRMATIGHTVALVPACSACMPSRASAEPPTASPYNKL